MSTSQTGSNGPPPRAAALKQPPLHSGSQAQWSSQAVVVSQAHWHSGSQLQRASQAVVTSHRQTAGAVQSPSQVQPPSQAPAFRSQTQALVATAQYPVSACVLGKHVCPVGQSPLNLQAS
jgi:hypothetical protein